MSFSAKVSADPCPNCSNVGGTPVHEGKVEGKPATSGAAPGAAKYALNKQPIGCAACLSRFFQTLPAEWRPWPMTFWDDVKRLFKGVP
jgi:hypothetical protein